MIPSESPSPSDQPTGVASDARGEPLAIDTTVDGRYRITGRLGAGGMGSVYRAVATATGRPVAIKVLDAPPADQDAAARRFRREAAAPQTARHPAFVEVFEAGTLADGRAFLVMELIDGRPLSRILPATGPMETARAARLVTRIAAAIATAHRAGIVHRDLKPDNVMVLDDDRVRVLDFGIAHVAGPLQSRITVGDIMGTAHYMAPEQARADPPTAAADVYALGVILYEMLTGEVPITGATSLEILANKSLHQAPSLGIARPDLPASLVSLVDACLDPQPHRRPTTEHLCDALSSIGAPRPPSPPPPTTSRRRRSFVVLAVAAAILGALVGAAGVLAFEDSTSPPVAAPVDGARPSR